MVVAAQERADADLVRRRAAELAAPHDERFVEQAAGLQVVDQGRDRLVDLATLAGEGVHEVIVFARAVHVPAGIEQLHEPHALFDEPPGQEAVVGKRHGSRLSAVGFVNVLRLAGNIHHFGNGDLHAVGQLVLADAGNRLGVAELG